MRDRDRSASRSSLRLTDATASAPEEERAGSGASVKASGRYLWWMMTVLLLVNILNFVDRQLPFILAQSIKEDLGLSDAQLGVMGGAAFAIVYSTLGLPLARLAERAGRKWVLAGSLCVWSLLTASAGLVATFPQLLATRLGVAAGEAGSTPVGHSLISAYFPERRRGLALSIFGLGVPLGTMIGLGLGGWLDQVMTWRHAMIAIGLPGILLALLVVLTVREPPRKVGNAPDVPLFTTLRLLGSRRSFRHMAAGIALYSMGANATIVFVPAFLMRTYEMTSVGAGMSLGVLYGIAGVAGTLAGGFLGDKLGARDARWRLWVPALGLALAMPFTLGAWFAPTAALSVLLLAGPKIANLLYIGPVFVALHSIAPLRARATASAFLLFFNSLIGASLGPLIVGLLSDWLQPSTGALSLRYALCFVVVTQAWAALHLWTAARTLRDDAETSAREDASGAIA
jgi:predicted MFS family arabinose efflux permease